MTREEFIKQRCKIDKITEEEFERIYRVVECNCGKIYCKGYRCLDLDGLLKENQKLKKQLEEYQEEVCILDMRTDENIKYKNQQKEFINYLEDEIKKLSKKWGNKLTETGYLDIAMTVRAYRIILQKYKEIIGDDK